MRLLREIQMESDYFVCECAYTTNPILISCPMHKNSSTFKSYLTAGNLWAVKKEWNKQHLQTWKGVHRNKVLFTPVNSITFDECGSQNLLRQSHSLDYCDSQNLSRKSHSFDECGSQNVLRKTQLWWMWFSECIEEDTALMNVVLTSSKIHIDPG